MMFIDGLWGDEKVAKWPRALASAAYAILNDMHPLTSHTYAYGRSNHRFLNWLGVSAELLGEEGVCRWKSEQAGRDELDKHYGKHKYDGLVNWGVSLWRHKLEIIHKAVREFGEVVWLDWNCWQVSEVPPHFWDVLRKGKPIQALLCKSSRGNLGVNGSFIYCRSEQAILDILDLHQEHPAVFDEVLLEMYVKTEWGDKNEQGTMKDMGRWIREGWQPAMVNHKFSVYRSTDAPVFSMRKIASGHENLSAKLFCEHV
jgi:hypothetical protein